VTTSYGAISVNAYHSISGSAAPAHDANGKMSSGPVNGSATSGMVYGKENNNLLQAVSGHASDYVYDAMGRLVQLTRHDVGAGQSANEKSHLGNKVANIMNINIKFKVWRIALILCYLQIKAYGLESFHLATIRYPENEVTKFSYASGKIQLYSGKIGKLKVTHTAKISEKQIAEIAKIISAIPPDSFAPIEKSLISDSNGVLDQDLCYLEIVKDDVPMMMWDSKKIRVKNLFKYIKSIKMEEIKISP
jgi:hypothetical protein